MDGGSLACRGQAAFNSINPAAGNSARVLNGGGPFVVLPHLQHVPVLAHLGKAPYLSILSAPARASIGHLHGRGE